MFVCTYICYLKTVEISNLMNLGNFLSSYINSWSQENAFFTIFDTLLTIERSEIMI